MRTLFRSSLLTLATLSLVLGVAGTAAAAEPTVGGTLSAEGKTIRVFSNGNVPAHVTMSATDVTLSTYEFDLQPGETHSLTFTGKAVGSVSALYTTAALTEAGDRGSAELTLRLIPGVPPPPSPLPALLLTSLLALALLLLLRRTKPWQLRLSRASSPNPS